ncbi:FAD-binding oxidoreductase [Aquabacterium soli]|uniref:FAD-binding oxidoreductase n=2 Tax=Aquabacterium soli TaxID=2493092 RepID=A0A426VGV4_9BURK|nr:FAD-binding oxidoreductase [Aquabacterium soli]
MHKVSSFDPLEFHMNDVTGFLSHLGDIPTVSDPDVVRRRSRDMSTTFSPIIRRDAADKVADLIVKPRDQADVIRVARAAALTRMPLMMRGAGTCNLGQGVPLRGGAIVDMSALSTVLWTRNATVRAQAGARLVAIDEATRPTGWELRMHSSTKRAATVGGYIGGGHAGIGSCTWGILRDRGNILGLQMVSVEAEPKVYEVRGSDVNLAHHAYGTNGIITEVEMPLAPAWPWVETVANFPGFMVAARFAYALAAADGLVKKLISIDEWPNWDYMTAMRPFGREGHSMVRSMVAQQGIEAFRALVAEFGGEITVEAAEGEGPYHAPLWEFGWGHARLQVNKTQPNIVNNIGLYLDPDLLGAVERSQRRFKDLGGMHLEVKRYDGRIAFQGSPYYQFEDEAQVAEVIRGMAEDGAMVANNHTYFVKENGMKAMSGRDAAFKRQMDPHNLMNPGKMDLDDAGELAAASGGSSGLDLPTTGWQYGQHTQAQVMAEAQASTPPQLQG